MKNTEEKSKKTNKILFIILMVLVSSTLILTITYALFSALKKDDTEIRIGKLEVELKENWPSPGGVYDPDSDDPDNELEIYDEFGISNYEKTIWGKSVGDLPAYVRVRCIPVVQYYLVKDGETEGEWITAPVPQEDIILLIECEAWIREGDYYYFSKIVEGYGETDKMSIKWQLDEIPSEIKQYQIRTDVRVILEYAQTTNGQWKEIFQIEELPEGIEKVVQ